MKNVQCFTSATFAYLDRVRVLGETLRRHHPDWTLWICLSDQEPPGFSYDPAQEAFDHVVRLNELGIPDLYRWLFSHDVVEVCTAVKGEMLCRLLELGAEKVIYLDPDIAVFSSLSPLEELLESKDIVLTPHQTEPDGDTASIIDNEIGSLKYGIYNLGFLAVANRPEGRRFAKWWRDRLMEFCYDDVPSGLFTDQRWCDHVPVFFDGVSILRDPGYNVASWNLSRRPITIDQEGVIRAAGQPLRFFHFTKVTWVGEVMLERYAAGRIEVFELMAWYRKRLESHIVDGLPKNWWAFGHYNDGTPIQSKHRKIYRERADLCEAYANPFSAGPTMFTDEALPVAAAQSFSANVDPPSLHRAIRSLGDVLRGIPRGNSREEGDRVAIQQLHFLIYSFEGLSVKERKKLTDSIYKRIRRKHPPLRDTRRGIFSFIPKHPRLS